MLLALLVEDTVGLTSVLGHVGVDELDGIVTDGGGENSGHGDLFEGLLVGDSGVNAHNGSCSHLFLRNDI